MNLWTQQFKDVNACIWTTVGKNQLL